MDGLPLTSKPYLCCAFRTQHPSGMPRPFSPALQHPLFIPFISVMLMPITLASLLLLTPETSLVYPSFLERPSCLYLCGLLPFFIFHLENAAFSESVCLLSRCFLIVKSLCPSLVPSRYIFQLTSFSFLIYNFGLCDY